MPYINGQWIDITGANNPNFPVQPSGALPPVGGLDYGKFGEVMADTVYNRDPRSGAEFQQPVNALDYFNARDTMLEKAYIEDMQRRLQEQELSKAMGTPSVNLNTGGGYGGGQGANDFPSFYSRMKALGVPDAAIMSAYKEQELRKKPETKEVNKRLYEKQPDNSWKAVTPEAGESLDFGDKELIKKTMIEMPKLKKEAISGKASITQIDKALKFMEGDVTGKGGQVKAWLAPYAEMFGIQNKDLSDAQAFQLLTRAIIGPMRLEIVGSGPVSDWEQKLMQQISGGGGAANEAARELLSHWKKLAKAKVDNYNATLEGFKTVYPNVQSVYAPIEDEAVGTTQPQGTTLEKEGIGKAAKSVKMPDGTILKFDSSGRQIQ